MEICNFEEALKKIRVLCKTPYEGTITSIARLIDETLGTEKINFELENLLQQRHALRISNQGGSEECLHIEQQIAEKDCPFQVGDIIRGCTYECDTDSPACKEASEKDECNELTCKARKESGKSIEKVFLIGSISFNPGLNSHGKKTYYTAIIHPLNKKGRPSRLYTSLSGFMDFDCEPAIKIRSIDPPIYYKPKERTRYVAVFPSIDPPRMLLEAQKFGFKKPRIYGEGKELALGKELACCQK